MFDHLDIYTARERLLVGLADAGLSALTLPQRLVRRAPKAPPARILLLRLERIGDLLMTLGAIRQVRAAAPSARIDLVVGRWNEPLARLIAEVDRVETIDAGWLARGAGSPPAAMAKRAISWRSRRYDLSINFEGDVRSHGLPWLAGARRRVGFPHGGGRALLTDAVVHDARQHVAANSVALVERAFDLPAGSLPRPEVAESWWRLPIPGEARAAAHAVLAQAITRVAPSGPPLVAVHVGAGRAVKQWPPDRFGHAAARIAASIGAVLLFTGSPEDAPLVDEACAAATMRGAKAVRVSGATDLVVLGALLERCRLIITGDTGPMHLAAAVGTPVVAVFGPSMPWRYGPVGTHARIVRVDLPCSPCNRIRRPPARCTGRVPECLEAIGVEAVVEAGRELLDLEPRLDLHAAARE